MSRKSVLPAIGAGTPLRFLPEAIRIPEKPLRAIAVGWLTAFPASMLFAAIGAMLLPQAEQPEFRVSGAAAIFALVVFSPVLETLIMGGGLLLLLKIMRPAWAIVVSALGWESLIQALRPSGAS